MFNYEHIQELPMQEEEIAMLIIFVPSFLFGVAILAFILHDKKK